MRRLDSMGSIASTISPFSLASPSPCTAQQGQSFTHLGGEMTEEELVGEQVEDSLQRRLLEEQERDLERKVLAKQEAERIRWLQEDAQRLKTKEEDMEVMEKATTPRGRRALRDGEAAYTQHTQASLFRYFTLPVINFHFSHFFSTGESPHPPRKLLWANLPGCRRLQFLAGRNSLCRHSQYFHLTFFRRELALSPVKPLGVSRPSRCV